jgi:hypothetical protein
VNAESLRLTLMVKNWDWRARLQNFLRPGVRRLSLTGVGAKLDSFGAPLLMLIFLLKGCPAPRRSEEIV